MERALEYTKEEAENIEDIKNSLPTMCLKSSDEYAIEIPENNQNTF